MVNGYVGFTCVRECDRKLSSGYMVPSSNDLRAKLKLMTTSGKIDWHQIIQASSG